MTDLRKLADTLDKIFEGPGKANEVVAGSAPMDEDTFRSLANDLLQDATNFHGALVANKRAINFPSELEDALYALTHQLDKYANGIGQ